MTTHHLIIYGLPFSKKNQWTVRRYGKRTGIGLRPDGRDRFKSFVGQALSQWGSRPPIEDRVHGEFQIFQGKGQSVDADGVVTTMMDVLEKAGVLKNDYQVDSGRWSRHRDPVYPRVEIYLAVESGEQKPKPKER